MELDPQILECFTTTFIPRTDTYPKQWNGGRQYTRILAPLTPDIVAAHIKGQLTIGAYSLSSDSSATKVTFDADDEETFTDLIQLAVGLSQEGITPYIETSRRGGHLWLFTPVISGRDARSFGLQLIRDYIPHSPIKEVFPKQTTVEEGGVGSFVRLPLGVHQMTKRRYHFINPDHSPIAPTIRDQLAILTSPERVPLEFIQDTLKRIPPPPEPKPVARTYTPDAGLPLSERIKQSISVLDFISNYVPLNSHHKGLCPFHDDQEMSFSVNPERSYYYCFSCNEGGGIIHFWQRWRELHGQDGEFVPTIKELAEILGL